MSGILGVSDANGMEAFLGYCVCAAIAYLLGSVSFSILISRLVANIDIRNYGSGNAGTTNMLRILGSRAALVTLIGDFCKGVLSVYIGRLLMGENGAMLSGFFCILGHIYPIYFGFKGGKGVLTAAATVLLIDWRIFLILIAVFVASLAATRYVSLSAMIAAAAFPISALYLRGFDYFYTFFALMAAGFIFIMHRQNIKRLLNGTENKIGFSRQAREDKQRPPE